jgi:hypothetical protein
MGCAFGQGYYFSKPVVAEIALQFLLDQPFSGLLQTAENNAGETVVAKQLIVSEDDSPTSVLPAISMSEDEIGDDQPAPSEHAARPKRAG